MSEQQPIVTTENGQLQGEIKVDWLGENYYSFRGIPYAKPPLGNLRFKAPQPADSWKGVKDASKDGNDCFCRNPMKNTGYSGSEDCLFLNVYTPQLPSKNQPLKAVMVSIHGGAFTCGSGNSEFFGPEFLVAEDVVIVTINYRVGLLGFACFSDPALGIPGNAGLKDQVLALQWVQKNISQFGGDPNNVTIFGTSAGGASVQFLILSPLAKGLFHKAISQSGVATSGWARGQPTAPLLAKALELQHATEPDIVKILSSASTERILEIQEKLKDFVLAQNRPVGPVIESKSDKGAFLSCDPQDIINSGNYSQVPLIIGYTSKEGMMIEFLKLMTQQECSNEDKDLLPFPINIPKNSEFIKNTARKIKLFYYGKEEASMENKNASYLLNTDVHFFIPINNAVRDHSKTSSFPIYYYRMSVDTGLNWGKKMVGITSAGASHGDDIGYLFKSAMTPEIRRKSPEDITVRRFLKLWTTFAKHGDPNPTEKDTLINITWPPIENNKLYYLDIGENLTIGIDPDIERVEFWDEIFDSYYSNVKP